MLNLMGAGFVKTFKTELLASLRSELFIVFLVLAVGYLVGRVSVKGISFGSSGVFLFAVVAGVFLAVFAKSLGLSWITVDAETGFTKYVGSTIKTVKSVGLVLFITSIGFISGPTFIRNFKKKAGSFLTMAVLINVVAVLAAVIIIWLDPNLSAAQGTGILMGGLSTTPGLSAAQSFFKAEAAEITALSALCYPFGVLGIVLFVQLMPKILKKDMAEEVAKLRAGIASGAKSVESTSASLNPEMTEVKKIEKKRIIFDPMGVCVFSLAAALGMVLGAMTFKMGSLSNFKLETTGGALIMGLLFGHFNHIGRFSLEVPKNTLKVARELGLVLFLAASGLEGGVYFLESFKWIYLIYGAIFTVLPLFIGFIVARFIFKMELLNNLGTICGGMTSTPALGALIGVSGTEDVAHSYAAAYPISLFILVFVPQIINLLC